MRQLTIATLGLLGALFLVACDDAGDDMPATPPATPQQTPPPAQ
jgi:hypothetical protein